MRKALAAIRNLALMVAALYALHQLATPARADLLPCCHDCPVWCPFCKKCPPGE